MSNIPFFTDDEFKELQAEIDGGWITVHKHPEFDLWIYNYSKSTQYEWRWNKYTMKCRGLILDANRCLVAKGFDKFFTYDQLKDSGQENIIPRGPFDLYEKVDGSLGVMYFWEGVPYIATRGSFISDMAIEANKWLRTKYKDIYFNPKYSYNFEVIYPENKIVVDYGDNRGLVLLAVMENDTLKERRIYSEEFDDVVSGGIRRAKIYNGYEDWREVLQLFKDEKNFEGFVVHFKDFDQNNFRVKIKLDWYKKISYVMQNFNKRSIWKMIRDGQDMESILNDIDDEFYPTIKSYVDELQAEYDEILNSIQETYSKFLEHMNVKYFGHFTEKFFAIDLKEYTDTWTFGMIMMIHKGKNPFTSIWKRIEPKYMQSTSE